MAEGSVGSSEDRPALRSSPDPSILTTSALQREIATLKEQFASELRGEVKVLAARIDAVQKATDVFHEDISRVPTSVDKAVAGLQQLHETRFEGVENEIHLSREVIDTRFEGADRALKLLQDIADRLPSRIDEKISALKEIHGGQFTAIQVQFTERDVRSDKQAESSKLAVDAALQAAKEAVAEQARSAALATQKSETSQMKAIEQLGELIASVTAAINAQINDLKERTTRIEAIAIGQAGQKTETQSNTGQIIAIVSFALLILGMLFTWLPRLTGGK